MRSSPSSLSRWAWTALLLSATLAGAEELPFVHLTPGSEKVPLPSASVQAVHQDERGYVWLGFFSAGLGRYDGRELVLYGLADGLPDPTVRVVVEDGAGYLWVGTESGLVVSGRPLGDYGIGERLRFVETPLRQTLLRSAWLVVGPAGKVWAGTRDGRVVVLRSGPRGPVADEIGGRLPTPISALLPLSSSAVLAGLADGRVLWVTEEAASPVPQLELPGCRLTAMAAGAEGAVLGGCGDGRIWIAAASGDGFEALRELPSLAERVVALQLTSEGELWAASLGDGALRWTPDGTATRIGPAEGLLSASVWDFLEDREGNLWIGHNAGVSRLHANYRAFGQLSDSLPAADLFAVLAPTEDGVLWLGSGGGLIGLAPDGTRQLLTAEEGLTSSSVYSLARGTDGSIWMGTLEGLDVLSFGPSSPAPLPGTQRVERAILDRAALLSSFDLGTVYGVRVLEPGSGSSVGVASVIAAGIRGLALWDGTRWHRWGPGEGLPPAGATSALLDREGHLWVATKDRGVLRTEEPLDPSAASPPSFVAVWDRERGAPSDSVPTLTWAEGRIWAGTPAGLWGLDPSDPARDPVVFDRARGLGGQHVLGLARDPRDGSLWVTQNAGLSWVDPAAGRVRRTISKRDGLLDDEAWGFNTSLAVGGDGTVYFATPRGLSIYRPALDWPVELAPLLELRSAEVGTDAEGRSTVAFSFRALGFADASRIRYRTRLSGFDATWSEPTPRDEIRYTNLPAFLFPRRYVFEVVAGYDGGRWAHEPVAHAFQVSPLWWLRWWSILADLGLLGVAVLGGYQLRTRSLGRRNRELREEVADRTSVLRAHAEELETLDEIVVAINRELALEAVMRRVTEQGLRLLPQAQKGVFLLRDPRGERWEVVAVVGWEEEGTLGVRFSSEEVEKRYAEGAEVLTEGVRFVRDPGRRAGSDKVLHLPAARSLLVFEVPLGAEQAGLLVFDNFQDPEAFRRSDANRLRRYRRHAISALARAAVLRELEVKSRQAEEASQAKSAFLATMSHELRTPLNSIIGFARILLGESSGREERFLGNIVRSGEHLLALINEILDLSKIEAGRMELELETVDPREVIEGVCSIMHGVADQAGIRIHRELPEDLPWLVADTARLKQILYNLVANAVKFSPAGSEVTVWASAVRDGSVLELGVRDEGPGIAEADRERIFEEFRQLDGSSSRRFSGTGLGLALVRRLVELHGGEIRLDSELGRGSTFRVLLPLVADPPSEGRSQS